MDENAGSARNALDRELAQVGPETFTARDYRPGRVVHIVLFKFAPSTADAVRTDVTERFLALKDSRRQDGEPYILSIDAGPQASGEEAVGADYDLAFVVVFASSGDRNYYVGEPVVSDPRYFDGAHAAFKEYVGPLLDGGDVLVFDIVPPAQA
ncbi:Dabb family protein [Planctomonas deserti]|uniref:Dabb family protein n=1 Tax=Planctomonas deserti TaxID=2144185 RepID=UPI000D39344B|nr:Dabb family protein [Planctomonas deserti]